jgi:hypothetical protein
MRTRVLLLTIGGLVGGCEKVALWLWATLPEVDSILLSSRATAPQFMVCDRRSARSRAPYAGTQELSCARCRAHTEHLWSLTELSNVVAYACRHSRAEDRQMATPGQPTLYKPEYCELAHNYCLLGATNEVLGDFFGVTRRTIQNWIATHPDFAKAVRRGRAVADARWREYASCRRLSGSAPFE